MREKSPVGSPFYGAFLSDSIQKGDEGYKFAFIHS
jgi:hypothetical protein